MKISTRTLYRFFLQSWLMIALITIVCYWWAVSGNKSPYRIQQVTHTKMTEAVQPNDTTLQKLHQMSQINVCDTIHTAIVCMGKCGRGLATPMIKSMLHHRQNPIHFHFLVDRKTKPILQNLFDTWDLPDVNYTCYNIENSLQKVRWIPNKHYSGVYALTKLLVPEILAETLQRVVVLDTDLTFNSDIAQLWQLFDQMTDDNVLGLVENESDWYLSKNRWPAIGRGFNTGVMLMDLKRIRTSLAWTDLWHDVTMDNIGVRKETDLADQDILNAVLSENPNLVFSVPCYFNLQMSSKSLARACYGDNVENVKIIHWNSPLKHNVALKDVEYFRAIHKSFVNYDGYGLRHKLHVCRPRHDVTHTTNTSDMCSSFRAAQTIKLRTNLHYTESYANSIDNFDVSLVVQLSIDRIQFLDRLAQHWEGPISAAIYLSDCDLPVLDSFINDDAGALKARKNIGFHLVFKPESQLHYPVNYLRNVALDNVGTPYVFLMDVDFVPMEGLYLHLKEAIAVINPAPLKKCLVVAAFETQQYHASPPRDKAALVSRLRAWGGGGGGKGDHVAPFRTHEWPPGHRATNYSRWIHATEPYEVEWQSNYEPYCVVHRSVPKYDTRFSGFGWNKVSHGVELAARGWAALVLPRAFVTHTPHAPSPALAAFRRRAPYRTCLRILKQEFLEDLKKMYNFTVKHEAGV